MESKHLRRVLARFPSHSKPLQFAKGREKFKWLETFESNGIAILPHPFSLEFCQLILNVSERMLLEDLPDALLELIATFAVGTTTQAIFVASVCKRFHAAVFGGDMVWKGVFCAQFEGVLEDRFCCLQIDEEKVPLQRQRKVLTQGSWKNIVRLERLKNPVGVLNVHAFFSDGGSVLKKSWADCVFRENGMYCTGRTGNILVLGALESSDTTEFNRMASRREFQDRGRRKSLLSCLYGKECEGFLKNYGLQRNLSTERLEEMFLEIANSPAGLDVLAHLKFGRYPWFNASRESYKHGLRSLARKISRDQQERRSRLLIPEDTFALDEEQYELMIPRALETCPKDVAVLKSIVIDRRGDFTCPVRAGCILVFNDLPCDGGPLERSINQIRNDDVILNFRDLVDPIVVQEQVNRGVLPKLLDLQFHGECVLAEFADSKAPIRPVCWFMFKRGSREELRVVNLIQYRLARFFAVMFTDVDSKNPFMNPTGMDCRSVLFRGSILSSEQS